MRRVEPTLDYLSSARTLSIATLIICCSIIPCGRDLRLPFVWAPVEGLIHGKDTAGGPAGPMKREKSPTPYRSAQFELRYTCRSPHGNSRRRKGNLNSPGFGAHGPRAVCQSAAVRLRFGALLSLLDPTRIEVSVTQGLLLRQWDSAAAVA